VKILHTADWHAGRSLLGIDRTPEVAEALLEIAELAINEEVDLILVAGDLFDGKNPSAAAEAAVFAFFLETGRAGIRSVAIAGNHDSPARLDAIGGVLELTKVHTVGQPRVAGQGGVFQTAIKGQPVRVATLPFISERRIVRVHELLGGDAGQHREGYQHGIRKLIYNLTSGFNPDSVNLLMLHATMDGAALANSEYVFHSTESYTLGADVLPEKANYVALGHIHKAQSVQGLAGNAARYPGSILQLDFGEQGDDKTVLLLDARPGQPTEVIAEAPLRSGRSLRKISMDLSALDRKTSELSEFDGWLKLSIRLDSPRPGLKERILSSFQNVLAVETEIPELESLNEQGIDLDDLPLSEAYAQYYQTEKGQDLPEHLSEEFRNLHELVVDGDDT
jgi:exonuclease SbcD